MGWRFSKSNRGELAHRASVVAGCAAISNANKPNLRSHLLRIGASALCPTEQDPDELDRLDVAPSGGHMPGEPAKFADDLAILRVKDMFVAAIGSSVSWHYEKCRVPPINALFDLCPTPPSLV